MSIESIRSYLRQQIDIADESMLLALKTMLDERIRVKKAQHFTLSEKDRNELSDEYELLLKGELHTYSERELKDQITKNRKRRKAG